MNFRPHLILAVAAVLCIGPQSARATIDATLQMQLGNSSGAITDTNNHNHYLIQRTVEAIDYSDNLGEPVWAITGAQPTTVFLCRMSFPRADADAHALAAR